MGAAFVPDQTIECIEVAPHFEWHGLAIGAVAARALRVGEPLALRVIGEDAVALLVAELARVDGAVGGDVQGPHPRRC